MSDILERHYTLAELAKLWHLSPHTLRAWFIEEPGVIRNGVPKLIRGRQKVYILLRVPESVARRVYRRRTNQPPEDLPGERKLIG